MSQCSQCNKNAMCNIQGHLLCLDCYAKLQQANAAAVHARNESLAHLLAYQNYLSEEMEWSVGLRSEPPRAHIPQPVYANVNQGSTLNNINISNSPIGMLNTGSIQDVQCIDINVTALAEAGNKEMAQALTSLTEAVASCKEASNELRGELLDQLNEISSQAASTPEARKVGVIKPVLTGFATGLNTIVSLSKLWSMYGDVICRFFGVENPIKVPS